MPVIPLMVDLKGKNVVIVGGGRVAERRVDSLLDSEGRLTVISPALTGKLHALSREEKISWRKKEFEPNDVTDAFLIISAVDKAEVNQQVIQAAPADSLLNAATEAEAGNVHFPAHLQRGKLSIAVSTNQASPGLAKKIKQELSTTYDQRYEPYLDFLFQVRELIRQAGISRQEKEQYLHELLSDAYLDETRQQQTLRTLAARLEVSPPGQKTE